jgi:hypothetical protein
LTALRDSKEPVLAIILIYPQEDKLRYILRMNFSNASNEEAEYKALLHDMRM